MRKKEILFVIYTLRCGGAEHALVSLLQAMDYKKYNIDLLVLCETDMFYGDKVPKTVTIVEPDVSVRGVLEPTISNCWKCIRKGRWDIVLMHFKRIIRNYVKNNKIENDFWSVYWKKYSTKIAGLNKRYDVAIGFLEGVSIYFCVDKVKAYRKIGWIHTNYMDSNQNIEMDEKYFDKLDYLVTMSRPASETLAKVFPNYSAKINTIYNILDEKEVVEQSLEVVEDLKEEFSGITIVSVGNVLPVKGYDMALDVCDRLCKEGIDLRWIVVGRKDKATLLEKEIKLRNLENKFILIGQRDNPYKYMRLADIYVQCSRYEGFSTTIREAKVLLKPIVATNCQGINDQIKNQENGSLVDVNVQSIYEGILNLIYNPDKRKKYEKQLEADRLSNDEKEKELKKLYCLLD